jgi:hypothetical protein
MVESLNSKSVDTALASRLAGMLRFQDAMCTGDGWSLSQAGINLYLYSFTQSMVYQVDGENIYEFNL